MFTGDWSSVFFLSVFLQVTNSMDHYFAYFFLEDYFSTMLGLKSDQCVMRAWSMYVCLSWNGLRIIVRPPFCTWCSLIFWALGPIHSSVLGNSWSEALGATEDQMQMGSWRGAPPIGKTVGATVPRVLWWYHMARDMNIAFVLSIILTIIGIGLAASFVWWKIHGENCEKSWLVHDADGLL